MQPEKLKEPGFLEELRLLQADIQVVVAFRMLPEVVWNMPRLGTINVHGSLLPDYRGAAPINWAIINGEKYTGVTTFRLKHEIDTGNILLSRQIPIGENENAGELHDKMKVAGAELLLETLEAIGEEKITGQQQPGEGKHAPKIFTETCRIDWNQPTSSVHNHIRGLSPYPGAFTTFDNKTLKIFNAQKLPAPGKLVPGTVDTDQKTYLRFATIDGMIDVTELQLEGKKRMAIKDFLRGYHFFNNS